jgi:hypothetical protein
VDGSRSRRRVDRGADVGDGSDRSTRPRWHDLREPLRADAQPDGDPGGRPAALAADEVRQLAAPRRDHGPLRATCRRAHAPDADIQDDRDHPGDQLTAVRAGLLRRQLQGRAPEVRHARRARGHGVVAVASRGPSSTKRDDASLQAAPTLDVRVRSGTKRALRRPASLAARRSARPFGLVVVAGHGRDPPRA